MNSHLPVVWIGLCFVVLFAVSAFFVQSQTITINQAEVGYTLPYPGILPDHPFYIIKAIRDKFNDLITRDYYKKAQLYLLYSDKRLVMADLLLKKGKTKLAVTTLSKGEKYFERITPLVKNSKKQGVAFPQEFIARLRLANAKHTQIITTMIRQFPQGEEGEIGVVLELNNKIKKDLDTL